MTRISILCVMSSTLAVLALPANSASAGTLTHVNTTVVKPNIHALPGTAGGTNKSAAGQGIETKDFSFGATNPSTISSSTGGAGAGKVKLNEFGPGSSGPHKGSGKLLINPHSTLHRLNPQPLPPG